MKEILMVGIMLGVVALGLFVVTKTDAFITGNRKHIQKKKAQNELNRFIRAEDVSADDIGDEFFRFHTTETSDSTDNGVIDSREDKS